MFQDAFEEMTMDEIVAVEGGGASFGDWAIVGFGVTTVVTVGCLAASAPVVVPAVIIGGVVGTVIDCALDNFFNK